MDAPKDFVDTDGLLKAWGDLTIHANATPIKSEAYRLAFTDPEFLLRRETRGIRFQLEMLKPDLDQQSLGIEDTVVVFGSARFIAQDDAIKNLESAKEKGDPAAIKTAERDLRNAHYYEESRNFAYCVAFACGKLPVSSRIYICTGGGPGVMEAANRGASEAGEPNIGLNIALPHEQCSNPYVTPELNFKFHYFAARKMHFMMRAKALVAFPGGFGTLDELFEVLTLVQTGKAARVPIILFGSSYWKGLLNFEFLLEQGVISPEDLNLFHYTDNHKDAWNIIKNFYNLPD